MDNLYSDVSRATRAGMSYGYWKALHPNTKGDEGEARWPDHGKVFNCICCGKDFWKPTKRESKYCSDNCRVKYARKRRLEVGE